MTAQSISLYKKIVSTTTGGDTYQPTRLGFLLSFSETLETLTVKMDRDRVDASGVYIAAAYLISQNYPAWMVLNAACELEPPEGSLKKILQAWLDAHQDSVIRARLDTHPDEIARMGLRRAAETNGLDRLLSAVSVLSQSADEADFRPNGTVPEDYYAL